MPWPRPHCAGGYPAPLPKKGAQPPIFGPCLLWPNSWMDQDVIWYGGRPRPTPNCATWGPRSPKKASQPPNFRPMWPNGWMDQDATLFEGRSRPRSHSVTWGPRMIHPQMGQRPPIFNPCLLWPNGRPSQLLLSTYTVC